MTHFLENDLVLHPVTLYLIALSLYAINVVLYAYADRRRQRVTALSSTPALSLRARLSATFLGALFFLIPGIFLAGDYRALFAGAFVVIQICSFASIASSIQTTNALLRPSAVTGRLVYAQSTSALLMAANLSAFAIFAFAAFAFTGSPSFFAASLYLGAASIGYRRRAGQYAARERTAAMVEGNSASS